MAPLQPAKDYYASEAGDWLGSQTSLALIGLPRAPLRPDGAGLLRHGKS